VTATLSVEADHDTEIDVCVGPVAARLPGVVGACASVHALVDAVTDALAERLPDASNASTANV
jgi:hypothetical protein